MERAGIQTRGEGEEEEEEEGDIVVEGDIAVEGGIVEGGGKREEGGRDTAVVEVPLSRPEVCRSQQLRRNWLISFMITM